MKSILTIAALILILSLCNLTDRLKPSADSNPSNTNSAEAQNSAAENGHPPQSTPSQSLSNSSTPATDREAVKDELMRIENEMTTASYNGDISTLARYLADNFVGTAADGSILNKNQLLAATKPDKTTKSWKITDAQLVSLSEDSAVMTYIQTQMSKTGQTFRARVTDTFVKQNGHWLVKAEQQTIIK